MYKKMYLSFAGEGDTVFCFFCGQGLHSWEEEDDPWEEHAKWSPYCVFLKNVKGPDFIVAVQEKDTNPEQVCELVIFCVSRNQGA